MTHTPKRTPLSTRPITCIWIGTIALLIAMLGLTVPNTLRSFENAQASKITLLNTTHDASVIVSSQANTLDVSSDDEDRGVLTPRVTAALEQAGLASTALASLSPEAESQVASQPGLRVFRRRAALTLNGVTLPQIGKFLSVWRIAEPAWTPTTIDVSPAGGRPPETGGDLPLRTVITIETIAVRHEGDQQ
jgi:hypothetical protein